MSIAGHILNEGYKSEKTKVLERIVHEMEAFQEKDAKVEFDQFSNQDLILLEKMRIIDPKDDSYVWVFIKWYI